MTKGIEIGLIGKRIKEIRLSKEYKLTDIALKAKVSKGLLSRVENGRTIPSLPVLFAIISALEESAASFFENLNTNYDNCFYQVIRKEEYQPLIKEDSVGFNYFSIFSYSFTDITFQSVLLHLEPDSKREPVTTDGMEYIYLIDGEIEYKLGNENIQLKKGDSIFFDGRIPHLKINNSGKIAVILVIYLLFNK